MSRLAVAALGVLLGLAVLAPGAAQYDTGEVRLEVRVWQNVGDELDIRIAARPAEGSWRTLGTIPLPLDDGLSSTGRYRYGDITLDVPLLDRVSPARVEVRVWQDVRNSRNIHISARPAHGLWRTLGTIPLLLDDGLSSTRRYRFGDIALAVPLPGRVVSLAGRPGTRGFQDGQGEEASFGWLAETSMGLTVDRDGSVVVADFRNRAIRRISSDGTVTTIAGGNGSGSRDGPAEEAQFEGPTDVAIDPTGAIYVADCWAHRIRKITPQGMVTTVAGRERPEDAAWLSRDGPADQATFVSPCAIEIDPEGDLYIMEQYVIRRLSPSGWVSTFAGGSGLGYRDGPREDAQFAFLQDIGVDAEGSLYVLDANPYVPGKSGTRYAVRKVDALGTVSAVFWSDPPTVGGRLASPQGMAVSPDGRIFVTNTGRHQIVRVLGLNRLLAVAGTGEDGHLDGHAGEAAFSEPGALALSPEGALVVMDHADSVVRVLLPAADGSFPGVEPAETPKTPQLEGVSVGVFAGQGGYRFADRDGYVNGPASEALFNYPHGLAFAADGSVIVADTANHAIRRISPAGVVSTVTGGNGAGLRDGPPGEAQFSWPRAVAVDGDGTIYVADTGNGLIRRVAPSGEVETVDIRGGPLHNVEELALDGEGGLLFTELTEGGIRRLSPDGELSNAVDVGNALMYGFALDAEGTLFFATYQDRRTSIRSAGDDGVVSKLFQDIPGSYGGVFSHHLPGLALAPDGTLYVVDWEYGRVVRITAQGEAVVVVGRDSFNDSRHFQPSAILITAEGDLLVADSGMSVIWQITLPAE